MLASVKHLLSDSPLSKGDTPRCKCTMWVLLFPRWPIHSSTLPELGHQPCPKLQLLSPSTRIQIGYIKPVAAPTPTVPSSLRAIMAATPFFSLVLIVLSIISAVAAAAAAAACTPSDRAALLAFRDSLSDPYIGVFSSWTGTDCCSHWYGVSCDPTTGRVADLTLRGESEDPILTRAGRSGLMTGQISPEVCRLDRLTTFILADWKQISGPIPACITSLPLLRILDLVGNRLTGTLPADIGRLGHLAVLNVADNQLSGQIPASLPNLAELKHLDLSGNQITGPIPQNFGNLRMLSRALLARNRISGSIPASIGQMSRLADLDLAGNRISGQIPAALGKMPVLSTLYLDGNQINGGIPAELVGNKGVGILNLSRNAVAGTIPDVFWEESYLMVLDLSYNRLTGRVPPSLGKAKYVGHLDLSHNHLCGPIPTGSPFDHLEATSFDDNDCLCGGPLPACK